GGDSGAGGPGQRLRVVQAAAGGGGAVLAASPSQAPAVAAAASSSDEKVSRGYTEEMEHFAWCIRNNIPQDTPIDQHGLRCPGKHAMADAIMAITANLAMKHKKRIVFKQEWFDPDNPAVPETDPEVVG
ncbi:MAG TPA: gfo/Idh/MocA family oxidoreductase, partial [Planctomycetaceae bacterium]